MTFHISRLFTLLSRLPSLTTLAWIVASLLAFLAFLFVAPVLLNPPAPTVTPTAVSVGTPLPTATLVNTPTSPALPPLPRKQTPQPLPTLPPGAKLYSFIADPTQSGYITTADEKVHLGDRNLHAGFFNGQLYQSVIFFDLAAIPPNSQILYADLNLTGLSRDHLGSRGEWRVNLLQPEAIRNWQALSAAEMFNTLIATQFEQTLGPEDLDLRLDNQLVFTRDQLPLLEHALNSSPFLAFRIEGPAGPENNLFTWDGGGLDLNSGTHPNLRVIAIPGQFVVITNTPTPENVLTAAALVVQATADATRRGTPTPFPRHFATATPVILVTAAPTAANLETRVAEAQRATAVAITTGTYTPTPDNWIVVTPTFTPNPTPTPPAIPIQTFVAQLSPTPTPRATPSPLELLRTPVPPFLRGNIVFLSDRFGEATPLVIRPDGALLQVLTGMENYNLALAREPYSPDRRYRAIVAEDPNGILQIWILELAGGNRFPITHFTKGVSYDPVWSPDASRIAFVSTETGGDEIYVYDLESQSIKRITNSTGLGQPWNKHPSWSPDGRQIVFWSSRSGRPQIWIMNADGSNLHLLAPSEANDTDPIWVK